MVSGTWHAFKLLGFYAGLPAKGLSGIDQEDWQDASATVQDSALQAAVAAGAVTFVHSAAGMQDKVKQDALDNPTDAKSDNMPQHASNAEGKEIASLDDVKTGSIDDVTCLELD